VDQVLLLPDPIERLADDQCGVVSAAQARAVGLSWGAIDARRDKGEWRVLLAGIYLVRPWLAREAWSDLPFDLRLSAARLFHGPTAVAVLETSACLHGIEGLPVGSGAIHLARPPGGERHQQRGVRLHTWKMDASDVTLAGGVPATTASRTVADLICRHDRFTAVSVLDSTLNQGLLDGSELLELESRLTRRRGALAARKHLREADSLAQSPLESRVRLIASDAGLAPDHLQYPVRSAQGVLLGLADMAWERPSGRLLVAEADGRGPHEQPEALFRDRRRANDFVGTDLVDIVRFTWADLARPAYIVSVLRQNLSRR
jgi:hypothetical protein